MGVGTASAQSAKSAGAAAAEAAVDGRDPKAILVFAAHGLSSTGLLDGICEVTGDVPMIGATTSGEIGNGLTRNGSVTVVALGGGDLDVSAAVIPEVNDAAAAGELLCTDALAGSGHGHHAVVVLVDGHLECRRQFALGCYAAVGAATHLAGGGAGDGLTRAGTRQFFGRAVHTRGAVALGFSSAAAFGSGVGFGFDTTGVSAVVTEVYGDWIAALDHRPALDVYLEHVAEMASIDPDGVDFALASFKHPLGLLRADVVEPVVLKGADHDRRALLATTSLAEGVTVQLLTTSDERLDQAMGDAVAIATSHLDRPPAGYLVFDCVARWAACGPEVTNSIIQRVSESVAPAPLAGMATYGELGRVHGPTAFRSGTVSVLTI